MITQKRLKEILKYDPKTGEFINLIKRGGLDIGCICGCTHTIRKYNYTYILINVDGKQYKAHQLAFIYMTGSVPVKPYEIDHKNSIATDNRWKNLQILTHRENIIKKIRNKNNTSGHTGVTYDKNRKKWIAQITHYGKNISLGRYSKIEDAIIARKNGEKKYF